MISVGVVEDHPLFRDGLRNLLAARGIKVVGVASDGQTLQTWRPLAALAFLNTSTAASMACIMLPSIDSHISSNDWDASDASIATRDG